MKVRYLKAARRRLQRLPTTIAERIDARITAVSDDPFGRHPNVKPLRGGGYRLRIGDWRVLYSLNTGESILTVEAVEIRGGAYRS